jgi:hypothetical protein
MNGSKARRSNHLKSASVRTTHCIDSVSRSANCSRPRSLTYTGSADLSAPCIEGVGLRAQLHKAEGGVTSCKGTTSRFGNYKLAKSPNLIPAMSVGAERPQFSQHCFPESADTLAGAAHYTVGCRHLESHETVWSVLRFAAERTCTRPFVGSRLEIL